MATLLIGALLFTILQHESVLASNLYISSEEEELHTPCLMLKKSSFRKPDDQTWLCETEDGDILEITGLAEDWLGDNDEELISGETTIFASGVLLSDKLDFTGKIPILGNSGTPQGAIESRDQNIRHLGSSGRAFGDRTLLVVRVVALDQETSLSEEVISDKVFGTDGDVLNLVSQFKDCSYNKLRFRATNDALTNNGVITVNINMNVQGASEDAVRDAALEALKARVGKNIGERYDHVLLALPRGTGENPWVATALKNHYLSWYHDAILRQPSVGMHELGHNLNLAHSSEANAVYGDYSCLMGASLSADEGPYMCFNGAKNYQLGWYDGGYSTCNPARSSWEGRLIGMSDYDQMRGETITLKLEASGYKSTDHFLSFNRASGVNRGTREGKDQVLLHSKKSDYHTSNLIARLSEGETYTINGFTKTSQPVRIVVNKIDLSASPAYADVTVEDGRCTSTFCRIFYFFFPFWR